jgi:glycine/D-amino acid oxidase-like deaminating enzyme
MSGEVKRVAVIGAGVFGCNVALVVANAGYNVVLLERLPDIIMGTSKNNTNRVHQGFHYPRDMQTAIECRDNYRRFEREFGEALLDNYPNIYCIAGEKSLTSKDDFIKFCDVLGVAYSVIDLNGFSVKIEGCNLSISCGETILDSDILRKILRSKIKNNKRLKLLCNTEVAAIKKSSHQYELSFLSEAQPKQSFDAVVNCSYANINTLTEQLGYEVREEQYEYTAVPIISLDLPPTSITIMDGPFMTLFPYGKTKKFLLYHVDYSVIKTEITKTLNPDWLDPHKSPLASMDQSKYFDMMLKSCSKYVPALANAKLCGYLEAPRMVLPKHENDDARPSFVTDYGEGYFTIFSGKIDRSLSIADLISLNLNDYFNKQP